MNQTTLIVISPFFYYLFGVLQKVLVQELRHELMQGSKTSNSSASTADATTHTTSMPTASPIGQPRLLAIPTQGSTILPMGVVVPLAHVQVLVYSFLLNFL